MPWRRDVARVLSAVRAVSGTHARLDAVSSTLVGTPYRPNPLGGGPTWRERVRLTLAWFDCVTFVEAATALALSRTPRDYRSWVIALRYGGRAPSWENRLHYWSQWLCANERAGLLRIVRAPEGEPSFRRTLASVQGVPPTTVVLRFHPWSPDVPEADLVAFGSEREDLDVFHVGILAGGWLRHASRSAAAVVEEPLEAFLSREHGAGLLLARLWEE